MAVGIASRYKTGPRLDTYRYKSSEFNNLTLAASDR